MRKELLGAVVIFGLGAGGAFAQETTDPAAPTIVPPATEEAPATEQPADQPADTSATDSTAVEGEQATDAPATAQQEVQPTEPAAEPAATEGVVATTEDGEPVEQLSEDHFLASDLMGADLVQSDGTAIGEISDIVINEESFTASNVVIDVGGFLGIGAKTVTLPVDAITRPPMEDGSLQVGMTREEIEALPEFIGAPQPEPEQIPTSADPALTTDPATAPTN